MVVSCNIMRLIYTNSDHCNLLCVLINPSPNFVSCEAEIPLYICTAAIRFGDCSLLDKNCQLNTINCIVAIFNSDTTNQKH